ncbi:Ribosomal protein S6 kinase beta-2 [Geranomyces variabilis]|uniref:Ribosomal protein S6 kinase beta-2 n=1 Tax=Geranomyces variabilis TaxID=109894 RepID=A0AAD5XPW9_9FUNG|nr:Ribosomal protein S6 kinase beta-2 [Geranomyces variabilis]
MPSRILLVQTPSPAPAAAAAAATAARKTAAIWTASSTTTTTPTALHFASAMSQPRPPPSPLNVAVPQSGVYRGDDHREDDDEDDSGAVFAFDTHELFDAVPATSAGSRTDSPDAHPTIVIHSSASAPATPDYSYPHLSRPPSDGEASPLDSPGGPRRGSYAEPADVSQVLAIHDFVAEPSADAFTPMGSRKPRVGLSDFHVMSVIGKGAYGKVFLVRKRPSPMASSSATTGNRPGGELYAMKVLKKATLIVCGKDAEHTKNERGILEDVSNHPFIVSLHYAFQTNEKLYLILTYASGGELFTYLAKEKMFAEPVACFYVAELLLALEHLHGLGIIYRDLKPENVLLGADGHVQLTDFGLSKVALDARTVCGTIEFMAPEVLDDHRTEGYGAAVDYWSLGVMLFDMLTGSPPFTGNNRKKIMDGILKKKVVWPKYLTVNARDLCNKLLQKNPTKRLGSGGPAGAAAVKRHPFFKRIDWVRLAARDVAPPLVPNLAAPEDTSHFDDCFTSLPTESPADTPGIALAGKVIPGAAAAAAAASTAAGEDPLHYFQGFSYVAESVYL